MAAKFTVGRFGPGRLHPSSLVRFSIAIASVSGTALLRTALDPVFGDKFPLVPFFPAIIVSAWFGGIWPNIAATVISAAAASYFWITPRGLFVIREPADLAGLVAFVGAGCMIGLLCQAWRNATSASAAPDDYLKVAFGSIGDAVIATDESDRIVRLNPAAESLTGWAEAEAQGLHLADIFVVIDERTRENPAYKAIGEGVNNGLTGHSALVSRSGRTIPVDKWTTPIQTANGRAAGSVVVFRDITERLRIEKERAALIQIEPMARGLSEQLVQELRRLQRQVDTGTEIEPSETIQKLMAGMRSALASDTASLFLVDAQNTHLVPVASDGFQVGVSKDKRIPIGVGVSGRIAQSDCAMIIEDASQNEIVNPILRGHCKSIVGVPLKVIDRLVGVILAGSSTLRKFTQADVHLLTLAAERLALTIERVQFHEREFAARQGAETAEEQLRLALQSGRMGTWQWMIGSGEVKWSATLQEIHGYAAGSFPGTIDAVEKEVHPEDLDHVRQAIRNAIEARQAYQVEYRIVRRDRSIRWVEGRGEVFRDRAGRPERMLGVCSDITERKQAEARAKRDAEEANRAKDEFLAMLSHELRTPLSSILGWAVILRSGRLSADHANRALEVIERNARAETQLVESLLDVSRIVSGQLKPAMERVDLVSSLQAVIESLRPVADNKGVLLNLALPPGPVVILGDSVRLQQIFSNLISNAVKFTRRDGHIRVRLKRAASRAEIQVEDDGEGISPEFLPKIFDRFWQADSVRSRAHGGLGLGLAIVRELVNAHGGTVVAQSPGKGRGSTFTVTFPVPSAMPRVTELTTPAAEREEPSISRLRVLLVDDDPDARDLVVLALESRGASVRTASSARDALDSVRQERPDVLLADIEMPQEDGYALIQKVRALEKASRQNRLPSIALTAYASATDREQALTAGFDLHLTKPVDLPELARSVAKVARAGVS